MYPCTLVFHIFPNLVKIWVGHSHLFDVSCKWFTCLLGRQVLDIMNSQLFMFNSFVVFHTSALYNSASAFISKEEIQSLSYQKHSISSPFPCPLTYHEPYAPSIRTVNQLRPQDIDIVASIGDSISAGEIQAKLTM